MDPNATWQALLEAYKEGDEEELLEACRDLHNWMATRGFPPTIVGIPEMDRLMAQSVCSTYLFYRHLRPPY
jgi:hypothetical protein